MIDDPANFGLWGDGRGEDELSPEEIQMVKGFVFKLSVQFSLIKPYLKVLNME